jgi:hypothetical protein
MYGTVSVLLHRAGLWWPGRVFIVLSLWLVAALRAAAENASGPLTDKSCYNLFNPTPPDLMRELNADRPDKTDCPFTVDTWLTYQVNKNLRLDGGVYIGVTPAADDWHPWIGMTWRH